MGHSVTVYFDEKNSILLSAQEGKEAVFVDLAGKKEITVDEARKLAGGLMFAINIVTCPDMQVLLSKETKKEEGRDTIETGPSFVQALTIVLNNYSREGASNTPDFILANYMKQTLAAWEDGVRARDAWLGTSSEVSS